MSADASATVLVIEDDRATQTFLADNLTADGYELVVGEDVSDGLRLLTTKFPDLLLVDVGLPDGSGLDLVDAVRRADRLQSRLDPRTPIIVMSGRSAEIDRLRGFSRGADDYVCKPFSYAELRARIDALLRRVDERSRAGRVRIGSLEIDPPSRQVLVAGREVHLSAKEYALLRTLAAEPTRVFTKDELLQTIWGFRHSGTTRTLDSHACRLRLKLTGGEERFVVNVWGVGYRLVDAPAREAAA